MTTFVPVADGSQLDFGGRALTLRDGGGFKFSGSLKVLAGACNFEAGSKIVQTSSSVGGLTLQCDGASLSGQIKLAAAAELHLFSSASLTVTASGKVKVKGDSILSFEIVAGDGVVIAGDITAVSDVFAGTLLIEGDDVTVTSEGSIIGKTFSHYALDGDRISLRARTGDVAIDGKFHFSSPRTDGADVQGSLRATHDIRAGAGSKIEIRAASSSSSTLFLSTPQGLVRLAGKVSVHGRKPTDYGGTIGITACGGDVEFGDRSLTYFAGGPPSLLSVAASGAIRVGDATNPSVGATIQGDSAMLWAQTTLALEPASHVEVLDELSEQSVSHPPYFAYQDNASCHLVEPDPDPDPNCSSDCTVLHELDNQPGPVGVAAAPNGDFYFVLQGIPAVIQPFAHYDANFNFIFANYAGFPYFLAKAPSGDLYVTSGDADEPPILRFNADDGFVGGFGGFGYGDGLFSGHPMGIAADPDGNVYVGDSGTTGGGTPGTLFQRIHKFASDGTFLLAFGGPGSDDGQFSGITGLAFGSAELYVAEQDNRRVQVFDPQGHFIRRWGTPGTDVRQLDLPWGIALDAAGNVYIADNGQHMIKKFTPTGDFLAACGHFATGDGATGFFGPSGIAVDAAGNILVVDTGNDRVVEIAPF